MREMSSANARFAGRAGRSIRLAGNPCRAAGGSVLRAAMSNLLAILFCEGRFTFMVNWNDYYSPEEAIEVLKKNSNRPGLKKDYLRTLARYGVLTPAKIGNVNMYPKREVDAYIVEGRGEKIARLNRQKASGRSKTRKRAA